MHLVYDDEGSKWQAESFEAFNQSSGAYEEFTLGENQELNEDSLRELKNALDDLEIVDVEKKPDGLSADLSAGEDFMNNNEALRSLAKRGFLPVPVDPNDPNSAIMLLSSEGEIVVTLKDGVEYVLRFGDLQLDPSAESGEKPDAEAAEGDADEPDNEGLNRYLFVMARFNESAIANPELEELPELPAEEESPSEEASDAEGGEDAGDSEAANGEEAGDDESGEETSEDDKPTREEIEAERKRIDENNKRAEEEYQETIEKSKERVEELNARFGDWYYVIPNDVFKKIHLGRDAVVKTNEPEPSEDDDAQTADESDESVLGAPGTALPGLPSAGPDVNGDEATATDELPTDDSPADEAPAGDDAPGNDQGT